MKNFIFCLNFNLTVFKNRTKNTGKVREICTYMHCFAGLPKNFHETDFKPPYEVPCIIQLLCDKHEGLVLEAKGIKEHWFKPYIKKLFDKKVCSVFSISILYVKS